MLPDINFNVHSLIRNDIPISKKVINPFVSGTLVPQLKNLNTDFVLGNFLFGWAKANNNSDLDKYKYTAYRTGFDSRSEFLFTDGEYGKKCHCLWSWYELICTYR